MSTTSYVGVDWDSGFWLAVSYDSNGEFNAVAEPKIEEIWNRFSDAGRIVIDVPIGLCGSLESESGDCERDDDDELVRPCDRIARSILEFPRSTSVFNAPARGAVELAVRDDETPYQDVNQENKDLTGKGLTQQSANLAAGIQAVDQLLEKEEDVGDRLVEGHPEICFRAFADEHLRHSKKTAPGVDERLTALESTDEYEEGDWRDISRELYEEEGYVAGLDDVLDAIVLAVTACAEEDDDLQTLPDPPGADSEGRKMQMVYRRAEPFAEVE
jgi:predicted RNase H-like nuclease